MKRAREFILLRFVAVSLVKEKREEIESLVLKKLLNVPIGSNGNFPY